MGGVAGGNIPTPDQIEVTLIGPGYGESAVIHLGGGRWVVIDSCHDELTARSAPLGYLTSLGVDPASQVDLVLATHWHDDHIKGMAELFGACSNAKFCCSMAFRQNEFQAMLDAYNSRSATKVGSGVKELYDVFAIIRARDKPPRGAVADRPILSLEPARSGHGRLVRVTALSPCDRQIERFFVSLGELMPPKASLRMPDVGPNHLSVVAWIEFDDTAMLFGADLEELNDPQTGWSAVVASTERPQGKAFMYKVAHHGSQNGHLDAVWQHMLAATPIALLCPYNRGHKLPSKSDVDRITALAGQAYVTSGLAQRQKRKMQKPLERAIAEGKIKLSAVEPPLGMIRIRNRGVADFGRWDVELLREARELKEVFRPVR